MRQKVRATKCKKSSILCEHSGQILGSNVGPGGSGQTIHLAWVKGYNKIGLGVDRLSHNKDFYYYNYFNGLVYPGPNYKYWSDFTYTLYARLKFGNFILSSELKKTESYNYLWTKLGSGGLYGPSDTDRFNTQLNFSFVISSILVLVVQPISIKSGTGIPATEE